MKKVSRRNFLKVSGAMAAAGALAACGGSGASTPAASGAASTSTAASTAAAGEDKFASLGDFTMTVGHAQPEGNPRFVSMEQFAADVAEATNGHVKIEVQAPDLDVVRRSRPDQSPSRIGPHVLDICRLADIVFLGLHGQDGEDGRIQATLDLLGVPYTGAGYLGSAIAMDKIAAKEMMDANGIPNPKWQKLTYTEEEIPQLAETLPMPCVVKAPTGGSSLGVYLPKDRAELADALRQVRSFCHEVLVEQRIYGRELTDAVLGERYLPPVETFPSVENFDYEAKYQAGGAKEICPAELTEEQAKAVGEMALRVHKALGLAVYSRTDMIMDENGNISEHFYINDAKNKGIDRGGIIYTKLSE